jgi:hypothetical protein
MHKERVIHIVALLINNRGTNHHRRLNQTQLSFNYTLDEISQCARSRVNLSTNNNPMRRQEDTSARIFTNSSAINNNVWFILYLKCLLIRIADIAIFAWRGRLDRLQVIATTSGESLTKNGLASFLCHLLSPIRTEIGGK